MKLIAIEIKKEFDLEKNAEVNRLMVTYGTFIGKVNTPEGITQAINYWNGECLYFPNYVEMKDFKDMLKKLLEKLPE